MSSTLSKLTAELTDISETLDEVIENSKEDYYPVMDKLEQMATSLNKREALNRFKKDMRPLVKTNEKIQELQELSKAVLKKISTERLNIAKKQLSLHQQAVIDSLTVKEIVGTEFALSQRGRSLLTALLKKEGGILRHSEIDNLFWGDDPNGGPMDALKVKQVEMSKLRKMVREKYAINVAYNEGYYIVKK